MLNKKGIRHNVLNAKYHRASRDRRPAGRYQSVTISTNMAAGHRHLAGRQRRIHGARRVAVMKPRPSRRRRREHSEYKVALEKYRTQCDEEKLKVIAAGGLHILGTERHAARIDNQLRGRSGRQGIPARHDSICR